MPNILDDTRVRSYLFAIELNTVAYLAVLTVDGFYSINGSTIVDHESGEFVPITGAGRYHMTVKDAKVIANAEISLDLWSGQLHVTGLNVELMFEDILVTAEGAAIGGELIDWDLVAEHNKGYFDMLLWRGMFQPEVLKTVKEDLRAFIRGKTMTQIVEIINSNKGQILLPGLF